MAYHHITRIPVHRTTKAEKKFSRLARSIPLLDHPNFARSMRELENLSLNGVQTFRKRSATNCIGHYWQELP